MIARCRILLFERSLMFLVDDDQSEFAERQKHSRTHAEDNIIGIGRKLFFPYFHPFGITVFGVIDAHSAAKHPLQPFADLNRQCDFRQEIEHLFMAFQGLFYQVDVDFRLSRRGDTVQQRDAMFHKRHQDVVIRLLLRLVELLHAIEMRLSGMVQPSHLLLVSHQHLAFHQVFQHRRCAVTEIHQFILRNLCNPVVGFLHFRPTAHLVPVAQCQIVDECLLLFGRTSQLVERDVQRLFTAVLRRKRHIGLHLRFVAVARLQSLRHGGIIDLTQRRHIVFGYPLPQSVLFCGEHRSLVHNHCEGFRVEVRLAVVHADHNGDVGLAAPKRHDDTHAKRHLRCHFGGNGIGEKSV